MLSFVLTGTLAARADPLEHLRDIFLPTDAFVDEQPIKVLKARSWGGCMGEWVETNHFSSDEREIGVASNRQDCAKMVKDHCPMHDLANFYNWEGNTCWCQRSFGGKLKDAPKEEAVWTCRVREYTDVISPDGPSDGCLGEWTETNHFNSDETPIGFASSHQECVRMVKEQCPMHDLANFDGVEDNTCWCQRSLGGKLEDAPKEEAVWTCRVRDKEVTFPDGPSDGCMGEWKETNDFYRDEKEIGVASSPQDCVKMVKEQCPMHDLANFFEGSTCWCQRSLGGKLKDASIETDSWTCRVRDYKEVTFPDGPSDGCMGEWKETNDFHTDEKEIGVASSHKECVKMVKEQCPMHDLANFFEGRTCWCQRSLGGKLKDASKETDSWTCRVRDYKDVTSPAGLAWRRRADKDEIQRVLKEVELIALATMGVEQWAEFVGWCGVGVGGFDGVPPADLTSLISSLIHHGLKPQSLGSPATDHRRRADKDEIQRVLKEVEPIALATMGAEQWAEFMAWCGVGISGTPWGPTDPTSLFPGLKPKSVGSPATDNRRRADKDQIQRVLKEVEPIALATMGAEQWAEFIAWCGLDDHFLSGLTHHKPISVEIATEAPPVHAGKDTVQSVLEKLAHVGQEDAGHIYGR